MLVARAPRQDIERERVEPAIQVRNLVKRYGSHVAVDDVSFDVPAGTVLALLGPNGAGKTSTVECIEGFRSPDGGSVQVLGHDPHRERTAVVARLGVMLQEGGAYQAATPQEMLRLYSRLYPRHGDISELIERLDLGAVAKQRYRTLSGGQKQRVNLALALTGQPEVLLLDEPTAGMDPQARRSTWELLREHRDRGVAVLLTTHLLDEAERLADSVAVIDRGELVAHDSPGQLVAAARTHLIVTTPAEIPAEDLAAATGFAVHREAGGRYLIAAGTDAIPVVTAWFAERGFSLNGVTAEGGLEDVYLKLVDDGSTR